ncbi:YhjD/YihY/BrkB family envelope integrity protein [Eubacteriaceae bacterium ES2]|nr:YhjD/YihY/BrkB family envelope integrity protein [Eubacteriaceae bacterium ES2]
MLRLKEFSLFILTHSKESNIINLSAQMAYRILMAFIPFLMLLYNFINIFSQKVNTTLYTDFTFLFPESFLNYFQFAQENTAKVVNSSSSNWIILFFILTVSVSASYSLINILNRIFKDYEKRELIALWIQAIVYFLLFLAIILLMLIMYLVGEYVIYYLTLWFHLSSMSAILFNLFTIVYFFVVSSIILTLIYMFAPKKRLHLNHSYPGAVFVSFFWVILFMIYRFFVHSNVDFTNFFTDLQGPFVLLFEVYLLAFILNLGAVVNMYFVKAYRKGRSHD